MLEMDVLRILKLVHPYRPNILILNSTKNVHLSTNKRLYVPLRNGVS